MRINIASKPILDKILQRKRKEDFTSEAVDLNSMLKEILLWANRFVPSESGSILLDDPTLNNNRQKKGVLYFVACFGRGSTSLVETSLPVNIGIVGQTYSTGRAYISKKVNQDSFFYSGIDKKTKFNTRSIICAPIKIKRTTIGVIELINRHGKVDYGQTDLNLLKIFAEYTSTLIQNSLDAKRFSDMSMQDNLTGLFNDRYFYDRLTKEIARAVRKGSDLSLLFLDLDRFKEVNDTYGHLAGSRVLTELGGLLTEGLQKTGAVAARYGGDEFTVIFPNTAREDAIALAENLRAAIEEFVFLKRRGRGNEKALKIKGIITASLGVASLRGNIDVKGPVKAIRDALIKQADSAMYRSKQHGKNCTTKARGKICPIESA